jgi:hypothetical protein
MMTGLKLLRTHRLKAFADKVPGGASLMEMALAVK